MHNYLVFLRKEAMELLRTKRLLGLVCVFVFFALTSPLLARYMAEFIGALVPADEALGLVIPDPVWTDSYVQFHGNIMQIGVIALILLFMGAIASERSRGTVDLLLTKGLGHSSFILAKFTIISVALLLTMMVSMCIVYFYTHTLFDTAGNVGEVFLGAAIFTLFLLLLVALTLLAGAISKSSVVAALLSFAGFLAILGLSAIPRVGDWLPGRLSERSMEMMLEGTFHPDLWPNIGTTVLLTAVCLTLAVLILRKREGA